jgi:cytoskeletal protein CcmA (bactofilin family)
LKGSHGDPNKKTPIQIVMTQAEFDQELASGKRSWRSCSVDGDLDISNRVIHGDITLEEMHIDGDLILAETVIHGTFEMMGVSISGDIDLNGLRVDKFDTRWTTFMDVKGDVIADDLMVDGRRRTLPARITRPKNVD